MKRPPDDGPPVDPVLAQLDALINGAAAPPPPAKAARTEAVVAQDPVLAQLDALINPGASASAVPPVSLSTPVGLVLSPAAPPPLLTPQQPEPEPEPEPELRGPPGLLREFGGVKGYMAMMSLRADAEDAAAGAGR
jgi:hypothetical protein